jgi:hypothetical protein
MRPYPAVFAGPLRESAYAEIRVFADRLLPIPGVGRNGQLRHSPIPDKFIGEYRFL